MFKQNPLFACFVTGTDTAVGKTLISSALLFALSHGGRRAVGMKPVAAGASLRNGVWHNDDADCLIDAGNVAAPQELTTPYLLRAECAPHISAARQGVTINAERILDCYTRLCDLSDAIVVEGVGGFRVPLSDTFDSADMARALGLPVILVVGLRLGCLNHTLLTIDAIAARGLNLIGWVGNLLDNAMPYRADNIEALSARISAPLIGCVPRLPAPSAIAAAACLDFTCLPGWPK